LGQFKIDKVYPEGVQSKYYRRILNRVYKFIDDMVENMPTDSNDSEGVG
jgi:hypothetical protein